MKLGLTLPTVGPAISSAAGLSAFRRGIEAVRSIDVNPLAQAANPVQGS
jgi:hypothetical protein